MRRKVDPVLERWAQEPDQQRKPLLIRGVRQCGKSYAVTKFLAKEFPSNSYVINFEANTDFVDLFEKSHSLQNLLVSLSGYLQVDFVNQKKFAIFLDEIQKSPRALHYLRFFKEETPHIHLVAAGSYLEYSLKDVSTAVGRTTSYFMGPMDFEEFLWAKQMDYAVTNHLAPFGEITANTNYAKFIKNYAPKISQTLHQRMMDEVYAYDWVGGMPAAVNRHLNTPVLAEVRREQNDLIEGFRDDFAKYANLGTIGSRDLTNINFIFSNIVQIAQKVKYSTINRDDRGSNVQRAISLLTDMRLFYLISSTSAVTPPLSSGADATDRKLFVCDVGLFNAFLNTTLPRTINSDIHYSHSGLLAELFVILGLISRVDPWRRDHYVHFWRRSHSGGAEIDALVVIGDTLCPIEVKRNRMRTCKSLLSYLEKVDAAKSGGQFSGMQVLPIVVQGEARTADSVVEMAGPGSRICFVPPYLTPFLRV